MKSKNGPWKNCIKNISKHILEDLYETCLNDMCSYEDDQRQNDYKCFNFEQLTIKCYELTNSTQIFWRKNTNCRKKRI